MKLLKHAVFGLHRLFARAGIHFLPVHYYSPVVNLLELEKCRGNWARRSELPAIQWDGPSQVKTMEKICMPYRAEYQDNRTYLEATSGKYGPGYGRIEAQALHAVVRHGKPSKIIEVGSGVSTACMLAALEMNEQDAGGRYKVTCIEPFPSANIESLHEQGRVELIPRPVQQVDLKLFETLGEGDLLFIDSSHVAKTGSDVLRLYLEVLPRLKPGVWIHIHDIYFPYDYSPLTLHTLWHWSETAFLRAYMTHNPRIQTIFCMSLMHHDYGPELKKLFPSYDPEPVRDGLCTDDVGPMGYPKRDFPCSIYLRTV